MELEAAAFCGGLRHTTPSGLRTRRISRSPMCSRWSIIRALPPKVSGDDPWMTPATSHSASLRGCPSATRTSMNSSRWAMVFSWKRLPNSIRRASDIAAHSGCAARAARSASRHCSGVVSETLPTIRSSVRSGSSLPASARFSRIALNASSKRLDARMV